MSTNCKRIYDDTGLRSSGRVGESFALPFNNVLTCFTSCKFMRLTILLAGSGGLARRQAVRSKQPSSIYAV